MADKAVKSLIEMDAESAKKAHHNAKAKGHKHGVGSALIHPPRSRAKANGAITAPIHLDSLSKGDTLDSVLHHLGINNLSGADGRPMRFGAVCLTHGEAVLCRTRHDATFGAVFTSGYDGRTPKQKAQSKTAPVAWCKGCVSSHKASV
tara:strand:- start:295 stop:738 length:444 start_codon:yes stop_codon:yes gene_type:complete